MIFKSFLKNKISSGTCTCTVRLSPMHPFVALGTGFFRCRWLCLSCWPCGAGRAISFFHPATRATRHLLSHDLCALNTDTNPVTPTLTHTHDERTKMYEREPNDLDGHQGALLVRSIEERYSSPNPSTILATLEENENTYKTQQNSRHATKNDRKQEQRKNTAQRSATKLY